MKTLHLQINCIIQLSDIKSGFLQSKHIDKDVKVNPLNEAGENPNKIWIFNTTIHDLTDTSRPRYLSVRQTFIDGC